MNTVAPATPRPWWQPAPFDYSKLEMLVMRALFAALLFSSIKWETSPYKTQRNPQGLAHWFDLTWLSEHPPGVMWQSITIVGLVIYVLGWLPAIGLAPVCSFALLIGTLVVSKAPHHSWQAITMIALAQLIVYAWPKKKSDWLRPSIDVHRLATYWSTVVFAAAYVVCGIVKLVNSDFLWIAKVPYLSVQLLKSNWSAHYDTLNPVADWLPKVTQAIVDYPTIARVFFGMGLLIELLGFVILINRKWAFWGGLCIIALHLSISKVMDLHFEVHMALALIFCVNVIGIGRTFSRSPSA